MTPKAAKALTRPNSIQPQELPPSAPRAKRCVAARDEHVDGTVIELQEYPFGAARRQGMVEGRGQVEQQHLGREHTDTDDVVDTEMSRLGNQKRHGDDVCQQRHPMDTLLASSSPRLCGRSFMSCIVSPMKELAGLFRGCGTFRKHASGGLLCPERSAHCSGSASAKDWHKGVATCGNVFIQCTSWCSERVIVGLPAFVGRANSRRAVIDSHVTMKGMPCGV